MVVNFNLPNVYNCPFLITVAAPQALTLTEYVTNQVWRLFVRKVKLQSLIAYCKEEEKEELCWQLHGEFIMGTLT